MESLYDILKEIRLYTFRALSALRRNDYAGLERLCEYIIKRTEEVQGWARSKIKEEKEG